MKPMNKNKLITMAAVVALSATVAFAVPHEGRGGHHGRGGELGARMAEKLNLSDAQKQQIKDLQTNFRESNKAFFDQVRDTHKQMDAAREANDTARLDALKATAESQHAQMKQLRDQQQQRIAALLTPEQRAQLDAMKAEREARRAEHGKRDNDKQ
jgi:Spy/CpxP family protein refolding chaperone